MTPTVGLVSGALALLSVLLVIAGLGSLVVAGTSRGPQVVVCGFLLLQVALLVGHFVFPLSGWQIRSIVGLLALAGLLKGRLWRSRQSRGTAVVVGASFALAALAAASVTNYDSAFYYHSMIAHLRGDHVVFGLANLHSRLGNSSGSLSLAAFLQNGPWGGDGYRLANALVILVALIAAAPRVTRVARRRPSAGDLITVIAVPLCLVEFLRSPGFFIAAPTPDTGFSLAAILVIAAIADVVTEATESGYLDLAVWASLALIYRPTGFVLVLLAVALFTIGAIRSRAPALTRPIMLAGFAAAAHIVMTVAITGFPLYPIAAFPDIMPWSVPGQIRGNHVRLITTFAREAGDELSGSGPWSWFKPWVERNDRFVVEALILVSLGFILLFVRRRREVMRDAWILLGLAAPPVGLWFWAAPDPRFGHGLVLASAAIPLACVLRKRQDREPVYAWGNRPIGFALVMSSALVWAGFVGQSYRLALGDMSHVGTPKQIVLESDGLIVTRPRADPGCGAALWCTPEDVSGLKVGRWGPFTMLSRD